MAEREKARRKLIAAIGLCLVFMIVEVIGGERQSASPSMSMKSPD